MKNHLSNLQPAALIESTIRQGQGQLSSTGASAAFTVVPVVIMGFYLWMAKRQGAFDAL